MKKIFLIAILMVCVGGLCIALTEEEIDQWKREQLEQVEAEANKLLTYTGTLVDTDSNPVSNAEIKFRVSYLNYLMMKSETTHGKVYTDASGNFTIEGTGTDIEFSIYQPEYYMAWGSIYHADDGTEKEEEIVLIPKGQLYDLEGGNKRFAVYPDKGVVGINFYRDQMVGGKLIPAEYMDEYADIKFEVIDNGSEDINDWQFKIWTLDEEGGFIEYHPVEHENYTDYIMREAPETGYQRELIFNVRDVLSEAGNKGYIEKQYYFKLKLRKAEKLDDFLVFGKIKEISIMPEEEGDVYIDITYAFNPDGTTYLED